MNEKKTNIGQQPIRDARTLGLPKMLVLGLQHMFAMFGATVLVPILVQSYGLPLSIQTTLFFAAGLPCLHQNEGPRFPGFLLRVPGRFRRHGRYGPGHLRRYGRR